MVLQVLDTKSKINKLNLKTFKNIDKNLENSFGVRKFKNILFNEQIIHFFFFSKQTLDLLDGPKLAQRVIKKLDGPKTGTKGN